MYAVLIFLNILRARFMSVSLQFSYSSHITNFSGWYGSYKDTAGTIGCGRTDEAGNITIIRSNITLHW